MKPGRSPTSASWIHSRSRWISYWRRAEISRTSGASETRRTSTVLETRGRAMKVSTGNRGVGAMADPATGRAKLTLSKVDWMGGRADRLRRDDEGNPRQALPVLLALRRTRRSAGPGVPVPRVRPIRGGPPEVDRSPRRVRGTGRGRPPKEAGGDSREGQPVVTRSP